MRSHQVLFLGAVAGLATTSTVMGGPAQPTFGSTVSSPLSLTNVHLLAVDVEFFGPASFGVWHVNDAPSGKLSNIDQDAGSSIKQAGGLYAIAGINAGGGVSIMLPQGVASSSIWNDLFQTEASDVKQWLLDSDLGALENWFATEIYDANLATPFGRRSTLISFEVQDPVRVVIDPPPSDGGGGGGGGGGGSGGIGGGGSSPPPDNSVPAPGVLVIGGMGALCAALRRR